MEVFLLLDIQVNRSLGPKLEMVVFLNIFPSFLGPDLPYPLAGHSMVPLGEGQVIMGGIAAIIDIGKAIQNKLYLVVCANRTCFLSPMSQELTIHRRGFIVIPIPDAISGCISNGKVFCQYNFVCLSLDIFSAIETLKLNQTDDAQKTPHKVMQIKLINKLLVRKFKWKKNISNKTKNWQQKKLYLLNYVF